MTAPPAPVSLAEDGPGRVFWEKVTAEVIGWTAADLSLLESVCCVSDTIAHLSAALDGEPLIVLGSMGQQREHPLLSEIRQQRALHGRLIKMMNLPDDEVAADIRQAQASVSARQLARKRWG